jgi:hypothetical protein
VGTASPDSRCDAGLFEPFEGLARPDRGEPSHLGGVSHADRAIHVVDKHPHEPDERGRCQKFIERVLKAAPL